MDANDDEFKTVSLRPHLIWGPGDTQLIPRLVAQGKAGKLKFVGSGTKRIDAVYIDNVVDANLRAATADGAAGHAFNVACGSSWTLNEVIDQLREIIGVDGDISYGPALPGDVPKTLASTQKAKSLLGYEPLVDAREGLERTVAWYREAALA